MRDFEFNRLKYGIIRAIEKFELNLDNKVILTEGATGNYSVTPILAAVAKAERVYALSQDSEYGSIEQVQNDIYQLANFFKVESRIEIIPKSKNNEIDYKKINIVTNLGFVRPINKQLISKLSSDCVIPLMYEPWEFRDSDLDIDECIKRGIKVYGTNESDKHLQTFDYIGFCVLYFLLRNKLSCFSSKVLLIGCSKFISPVEKILLKNNYEVHCIVNYRKKIKNVSQYDAIVILEHEKKNLIVGSDKNAFLNKEDITPYTLVIHICGSVDFENAEFRYEPQKICPFGYMSIRADYIDPHAVIDLHAAGLKVAEGMLKANALGLTGVEYKKYMEKYYPALAFEDSRLW